MTKQRKRLARSGLLLSGATVACLLATQIASAGSMAQEVPKLLQRNNNIKAAQFDVKAAEMAIRQARAGWYPSLSVTLNAGREKQITPTSGVAWRGYNQQDAAIKQLLWDFGKTNASIDSAKLSYAQSIATLRSTKQSVMLQGVNAYLGLVRAYRTLAYARRSERSIKKQVEMEKARLKTGSGFSTDVLEAQAQLSGAKARVTRARGTYANARHAYRAVFREKVSNIGTFRMPNIPYRFLPKTEAEAVRIANKNSLQLQILRYTADIARQSVRISRAALAPSFDISLDAHHKNNVSGVAGTKEEYLGKVEMVYPIFNGFRDLSGLRAARYSLSAAENRLMETKYNVDEQVRNAWRQLRTSRKNAALLAKQASTLQKFLRLAKKERKMGRRSLVDVLVSETNYINALSSGEAARSSTVAAAYTLLQSMGELSLESVQNGRIVKRVWKKPSKKKRVVRRVKKAKTATMKKVTPAKHRINKARKAANKKVTNTKRSATQAMRRGSSRSNAAYRHRGMNNTQGTARHNTYNRNTVKGNTYHRQGTTGNVYKKTTPAAKKPTTMKKNTQQKTSANTKKDSWWWTKSAKTAGQHKEPTAANKAS